MFNINDYFQTYIAWKNYDERTILVFLSLN